MRKHGELSHRSPASSSGHQYWKDGCGALSVAPLQIHRIALKHRSRDVSSCGFVDFSEYVACSSKFGGEVRTHAAELRPLSVIVTVMNTLLSKALFEMETCPGKAKINRRMAIELISVRLLALPSTADQNRIL